MSELCTTATSGDLCAKKCDGFAGSIALSNLRLLMMMPNVELIFVVADDGLAALACPTSFSTQIVKCYSSPNTNIAFSEMACYALIFRGWSSSCVYFLSVLFSIVSFFSLC